MESGPASAFHPQVSNEVDVRVSRWQARGFFFIPFTERTHFSAVVLFFLSRNQVSTSRFDRALAGSSILYITSFFCFSPTQVLFFFHILQTGVRGKRI